MRECKVDSRDLVYENADKLALCDVGKSPELVQCIEDLPEDIPANDPRVDLIVKSLFEIDTNPIVIERFLDCRTNLSDYLVFSSDFGESVLAAFLALAFFALFAKAARRASAAA